MFASAFHSPAFIWHASPAMTELENLVVDWLAQLFHLPECYQLRSTGGGTIAGSISEGLFSTCHAAKRRKMNELGIELGDARTLQFVGYYTQHSFSTSEKALLVKDIAHRRIIPVHYSSKTHNYQCDVAKFEEMLV
jgi:glutamate/tyrosine decarboxylase-like PLP-dependent enzyme